MDSPLHLLTSPWPEYELAALRRLSEDLGRCIKKVEKRPSTSRVHAARVVLRRWQSITRILDQDGLSIEPYVLVKKELNKLRKRLGKIRDWEILIELVTEFELSASLSRGWGKHCIKEKRKLGAKLDGKFLRKVLKQLIQAIDAGKDPEPFSCLKESKARHKKESADFIKPDSATLHLEPYLRHLEENAHELESKAFSPTQLHELRIAVKSWRYFLTEFYGLTNLQLVKAQQLLGKVHDIDRLIEVLNDNSELNLLSPEKSKRLNKYRAQLLDEFGKLRKHLPYGLRPGIASRAGVPEL